MRVCTARRSAAHYRKLGRETQDRRPWSRAAGRGTMRAMLAALHDEIVACAHCPRLVAHRERVAREKSRKYRDDAYWGRPLPGSGAPRARLVIVGLAPAAHGGNRTGRMFTGDSSGERLPPAPH